MIARDSTMSAFLVETVREVMKERAEEVAANLARMLVMAKTESTAVNQLIANVSGRPLEPDVDSSWDELTFENPPVENETPCVRVPRTSSATVSPAIHAQLRRFAPRGRGG